MSKIEQFPLLLEDKIIKKAQIELTPSGIFIQGVRLTLESGEVISFLGDGAFMAVKINDTYVKVT